MSSMGTPSMLWALSRVCETFGIQSVIISYWSDSYLIRFINSSRRYQCNLSYTDKLTPIVCVWCFEQYFDHFDAGKRNTPSYLVPLFQNESFRAKYTSTFYTCRRKHLHMRQRGTTQLGNGLYWCWHWTYSFQNIGRQDSSGANISPLARAGCTFKSITCVSVQWKKF